MNIKAENLRTKILDYLVNYLGLWILQLSHLCYKKNLSSMGLGLQKLSFKIDDLVDFIKRIKI